MLQHECNATCMTSTTPKATMYSSSAKAVVSGKCAEHEAAAAAQIAWSEWQRTLLHIIMHSTADSNIIHAMLCRNPGRSQ